MCCYYEKYYQLGSNVFVVKICTPGCGLVWETIVESINKIDFPSFNLHVKTKEQCERDGLAKRMILQKEKR